MRVLLVAGARVSGLSAQVTFLVRADWPQFHFAADRTGSNRYENVLGPETVSRLAHLWSFPTGGQVESSPVVAYGRVFEGSEDGAVYAVDAATGNLVWRAQLDGAIHMSSPAVAGREVEPGGGEGCDPKPRSNCRKERDCA